MGAFMNKRYLAIFLFIFLFGLNAQAAWDNIQIFEEDETGITFLAVFGDLRWEKISFENGEIPAPSIRGALPRFRFGEPVTPSQTILLAVPADAQVQVTVLDSKSTFQGAITLPIAPEPLSGIPYRELETELTTSADRRFGKAENSSLVQITEDGFMRDRRVVQLGIHPLQIDADTQRAWLYQEVVVRVDFHQVNDRKISNDLTPPRPDQLFQDSSRALFLNRQSVDRLSLRSARRTVTKSPALLGADADPAIKVYVQQRGLYKLTPADFTAAGVNPATVDPRTIKVHVGGLEIARYVFGEDDGSFDAGDYLIFYGKGISGSNYYDAQCYWITHEGAWGIKAGTRDVSVSGSATVPTSFPWTQAIEENYRFFALMLDWELYDLWYWEWQAAPNTLTFSGRLDDPFDSGQDATLRTYLHGKTTSFIDPDHHTLLRLNGNWIQDETWDGRILYVMENSFDDALLNNGSNEFHLSFPGDTGSPVDTQYVNKFEVDYQRLYKSIQSSLRFTAPSTGTFEFNISGFADSDVLVFEVTDPTAIVVLTGQTIAGSGPYSLAFDDAGSTDTWYEAACTGGFKTPKDIKLDEPSDLANPANGADYILITHDDIYDATLPLIARRQSQGLRAMAVKIEDICDEFSFGVEDPLAMQKFLQFAYDNWEAPMPLYILFFGDATIDYKDYLGSSVVNLVPSYLTHTASLGATPSDNPFLLLDGDLFPDFYYGRIPAVDVAYVDQIIDKIIAYEDGALAPWQERASFVADNDSAAFQSMSEDLIELTPDDFTKEKIYVSQLGGPMAGQRIMDAFGAGRLIINYFGHGSVENWAGELILESADIPSLSNGTLTPFVTVFNCLNGYFPLSEPNRYCLSEAVISYPDKGAVASFGPAGYGYTNEHFVLSRRLWNVLFNNNIHMELGAATTIARIEAFANYGVSYEIVSTYVLFGDPAMPLKRNLDDVDSDKDGYSRTVDCNDLDQFVYPGADELCDGKDNDCDDLQDEGCQTMSMDIETGVNVLGRTLMFTGYEFASDIVDEIEDQGGQVTSLAKWDIDYGTWRIYDPAFVIDDFLIGPEDGFMVLSEVDSSWDMIGQSLLKEPIDLDVIYGYSLVALPTTDYAMASDLVADMNAGGCDVEEISMWDTGSQTWVTYDPTLLLGDFALDRETGYFILGSSDCTFAILP